MDPRVIRVANTSYFSTSVYRKVRDVAGVEYQENSANENARKLNEEEVDVALIPVANFAQHGGYVGLDFGVACEGHSGLLTLFSHGEAKNLKTVYLYTSSNSSALLLQLLLKRRFGASARLVRTSRELRPNEIREDEGILVRHAWLRSYHQSFPHSYDLSGEWFEMTGQPYAFLVWATRPETLSRSCTKLILSKTMTIMD